jgi:ubiquinone/menaquinone biosynthesis C-methylase UbiE
MSGMDMQNKIPFDTPKLAEKSLANNDVTGWFDELYTAASGDASVIPWADEKPNRYLIEWLDANAISGNGRKAIVIGCGLGDDAEELSKRGFNVTAFDISETAINWAKNRFPDSRVSFHNADLFQLPKDWLSSFDFIFESYTIQALPRFVRSEVLNHIASLAAPGCELLIICRGWRDDQITDSMPWPLKKAELAEFLSLGFQEISFEEFWDYDDPERKRFRIFYQGK